MDSAQERKFQRMTQTPVKKLVCQLAVPTIISMLVTSFYNMADTFFVGKLENTSATAGVGIVYPLMAIIQAVGFFFGHGSGNYISRALGAHDNEDAQRMAATGFFSALIAGFVIMAVGLVGLNPLSYMLGATETTLPYVRDYMRFILIGAPYMTASLVLNNQMRYQANAVYAMVGIVSGAVINIGLDPLLIFVFDMGVGGAALATIISQFAGFVLLWIGTHRGGTITIRLKNFHPTPRHYLTILNGGTPSLLRQGLGSVATICLTFAAKPYGDVAIAGMTIVARIMQFANSCLIGFGQGFQPVCGFNYGAKLYARVREAFWFCVRLSTAVLIGLAIVGALLATPIVAIFLDNAEVTQIGAAALRWQCLTFPLAAWTTMCNMMTQTTGKAVRASFLAMARQGLFFVPTVLIMPQLLGLTGVEVSQSIADVISFAFAIPIGLSLLNEMKRDEQALAGRASAQ